MKRNRIQYFLFFICLILPSCIEIFNKPEEEYFGKPVNLKVAAGDGQATLIWEPSDAYTHYELVINYNHYCVDTDSENCTPFYEGDSPAEKGGTVIEVAESPYVIEGLTNELTYVISIVGYDNNDDSTESLGDVSVTPVRSINNIRLCNLP